MMSSMMSTNVFSKMPENQKLYEDQYDIKAGRWPKKYNECVVVLTSDGSMSDFLLYTLGLRDQTELSDMIKQFANEEEIKTPDDMGEYTYDDIIGKTFKLVNAADYYEYDSQYKVWKDKTDNTDYMKKLVKNGENLKIVGIVQPSEGAKAASLTPGICYPSSLVSHVVDRAKKSQIVKDQLANKGENVFTGEAFGEERKNSGLDMDSMFKVDESALQNAFGFDENAFSGDSLDLSSGMNLEDVFKLDGNSMNLSGMVNLDQVDLDLSGLPAANLGDMLSGVKVTMKPDGMQKLYTTVMGGYNEYVKSHPEADYSNLGNDFSTYLKTDRAKAIIRESLKKMLQSGNGTVIPTEKMQELVTDIMKGFLQYVQGKTDLNPDKYGEYLQEYLQTEEAQKIMTDWANEVFANTDINISDEELTAMANVLAADYLKYAGENGLADPTKMGEHFMEYLQTEDGQKRLAEGLTQAVDMDSLQTQITGAVNGYMKQAMGAYMGAMSEAMTTQISKAMNQIVGQMTTGIQIAMESAMGQIGTNLQSALGNAMSIDADAFAQAFQFNMTEDDLTELMMSMSNTQSASYDNNLQKLGYADFAEPSGINIYPTDFDNKEKVVGILDDYNSRMEKDGNDEQIISYTDVVGTLMSSVTDIVNTISYVLIAFVAISLVVSSIMIGVITYISVLERKKEIGILRAIGASKGNISQVFNAETFIIGLCAGLIGIGLTLLLLIPGNMIIHSVAGNNHVNAILPAIPAIVLIMLSVVLTLLGGLIPSKKAAKSDPVTALRTE